MCTNTHPSNGTGNHTKFSIQLREADQWNAFTIYCRSSDKTHALHVCLIWKKMVEAQWPIGYGVGFWIKRSSVRIRPWPLRWVLGQGSLLPLSQGEAFTLASISYLAILVKYILAKKIKIKGARARIKNIFQNGDFSLKHKNRHVHVCSANFFGGLTQFSKSILKRFKWKKRSCIFYALKS